MSGMPEELNRKLVVFERHLEQAQGALEGKSKEEQAKIIFDRRDRIINGVNDIVTDSDWKIWKAVKSAISAITSKVINFFGFDPFKIFVFEDEDENGWKVAVKASSDPHLWTALTMAAEILMASNSRYINHEKRVITQSLKGLNQQKIDNLAESVISFCKFIKISNDGFSGSIQLDKNDIKVMLSTFLDTVLHSYKKEEIRLNETFESPIVVPGRYGWIRLVFSTTFDSEVSCCDEEKIFKLYIEKWSFCFPDEATFRSVMRRIGH